MCLQLLSTSIVGVLSEPSVELPLAHAGIDARDEPLLAEEEGGEMKVRPLCEERGVLLRVGCGRPRSLRSAGGFEVRRERIDAHAVAHTDGRQDEGEDHRAGERHAELRAYTNP